MLYTISHLQYLYMQQSSEKFSGENFILDYECSQVVYSILQIEMFDNPN